MLPNKMQSQDRDDKDEFIAYLRGEFAAANAIIDSMCHHLRLISAPGDYDNVIESIQQRRCYWDQIIRMQPYFTVAGVLHQLQQVRLRRQQKFSGPAKVFGKELKRSGPAYGQGQRGDVVGKGQNPSLDKGSEEGEEANLDPTVVEETKGIKPHVYSRAKNLGSSRVTTSSSPEHKDKGKDGGCTSNCNGSQNVDLENEFPSLQTSSEKQNISIAAKAFVGTEMVDGNAVNVVAGLKLYEEIFDNSEVSKLVTLVNDLKAAGTRGHFQVSKRPMKGNRGEMIQLALLTADAPLEDEATFKTSKDQRIEHIAALLQDFIERLTASQVVTVKPDCCIIDVYNGGDYSQPRIWPHWYGRPVCALFLTDSEMTFSEFFDVDHPGDYRGSSKPSLPPGSMFAMKGRSAVFAKHAIPSLQKQHMLVAFTKSRPNKTDPGDGPAAAGATTNKWVPPPRRSPNPICHPVGLKNYMPVPTTEALQGAPVGPRVQSPNTVQPIFVAPAMPFSIPVVVPPGLAVWPAAPSPPPWSTGTGVFLPPGSGGSSIELSLSSSATKSLSTTNGHSGVSPKGKVDGKMLQKECNRCIEVKMLKKEFNGCVEVDVKMSQKKCNGCIDETAGSEKAASEDQQK